MTGKSKKEPWKGGAFFVRLARVDEKNPTKPTIQVPEDTARLLYRLHGKITPAVRELQLLMVPRRDDGDSEWYFNDALRDRLTARDAKVQQDQLAHVPLEILKKELEDRAAEAQGETPEESLP